jgi:hypothetical protein
MILDIISIINGRVKFVLHRGEYFFIEEFIKLNSNEISFTDTSDGKVKTLNNIEVNEASITTYGCNTIPNKIQIDSINEGNVDFFEDNKESHILANEEFDRYVNTSKKYIDFFGTDDAHLIKEKVLSGSTVHLERLKILGADRVLLFGDMTACQNSYIRDLYWKLIRKKLDEAISEIDNSILEIDDEEFKEEAEIIKKDLSDNVWHFRASIRGVTCDLLFNHWPTLLNPSPFSGLE